MLPYGATCCCAFVIAPTELEVEPNRDQNSEGHCITTFAYFMQKDEFKNFRLLITLDSDYP
jgi:hypothetical protein